MFLDCRPLAYGWDKTIPGGRCRKQGTSRAFVLAIINILTDLAILALPLPWLWNLQMSKSRKFTVLAIFLLGGL